MQAVTGVDMAIAIAQLGGIGILPVSQTIEDQADKIGRVKRFKAGFQTSLTTLSPQHTIANPSMCHLISSQSIPTTASWHAKAGFDSMPR